MNIKNFFYSLSPQKVEEHVRPVCHCEEGEAKPSARRGNLPQIMEGRFETKHPARIPATPHFSAYSHRGVWGEHGPPQRGVGSETPRKRNKRSLYG